MYNFLTEREKLDILYFSVFKPLLNEKGWHPISYLSTPNLADLSTIMVQPNKRKKRRNLIIFNQTENSHKTAESFYLPNSVMLDIDFKTTAQRQQLITDLKLSDDVSDDEILSILRDLIIKIPFCYYCDYSSSNKGIKALFCLVSVYYDNNNQKTQGADLLHRINYLALISYLSSTTPLKYHYIEERDYVDNTASRISQGTYTSNGLGFYLNPNYVALIVDIDEQILTRHLTYQHHNNNTDCKDVNDLFTLKMWEELAKDKLNHPINEILKNRFSSHYNAILPFLFTIKGLNQDNLKIWWKIISAYYQGDALRKYLCKFDRFEKYINGLKADYSLPLSLLLPDIANQITTKDIFNNIYNEELVINDYLSEKRTEIEAIIADNDKIVIKAPTGTGKTTILLDVIEKELLTGENKKIVLCIPKNSLLEQLRHKITKERPNINVGISYGTGVYYKPNEGVNELILTSTPKLSHCIEFNPYMVVVDEIHNLTTQANEIQTFFQSNCKTILISATPEPFLIGESGYYYLNVIKNKAVKACINIIKHNRPIDAMRSLIRPDKKQLFVVNDKEVGNRISEEFKYIRLMNKDKYDVDVINSELLTHRHYICTTFISDGLNFNNTEWDDIIIVDNISISFQDIYQITNRFRNTLNIKLTLITGFNRVGEMKADDINYKWFRGFNGSVSIKQKLFEDLNFDLNKKNYLQSNYYHSNYQGKYQFNPNTCKLDLLNMVINRPYYVNSDVFEYFLSKYFNVVYIDYQDVRDVYKCRQSNFKELIISNVDVVETIMSFGGEVDNIRMMMDYNVIDADADDVRAFIGQLSYYNDEWDVMVKRYNELTQKGLSVDYGVLAGDKKTYNRYVTTQLNQVVFNKEITALNGIDGYLWRCQHAIFDYMTVNSIEHKKHGKVIKCDDVIKYVASMDDKDIVDVDGRCFFNKSSKNSMGLFIKKMGVKRVRIRFDDGLSWCYIIR